MTERCECGHPHIAFIKGQELISDVCPMPDCPCPAFVPAASREGSLGPVTKEAVRIVRDNPPEIRRMVREARHNLEDGLHNPEHFEARLVVPASEQGPTDGEVYPSRSVARRVAAQQGRPAPTFQPASCPDGPEHVGCADDGCVAQPTRAEFDAAMDNVRRTPGFREEYERLVLDETAQPEGCEHNDRAVLYCLRCGRIKGTIGRRMELVPADVVEAARGLPSTLSRQAHDTEGGPGYQAIYATFMRAAAIAEEVLAMLPKEGE